MSAFTLALATVFVVLSIVRIWLARRYERHSEPPPTMDLDVTILQPILGGDPRLEHCLRANASGEPEARFLWLTDIDDPIGHAAAERAALPNVTILPGPPPSDGENPKLAKLERAFASVQTPIVVVLDDDTILPPETLRRLTTAAVANQLVTGLPQFSPGTNPFEALVAAFVNGNAWLTYLPVAQLRATHTINGMIYAFPTAMLREWGGFRAAGMSVTDDYAVAQLFARHGVPIVQSTARVNVSLTIESAAHYWRVMRRWMIFARLYFTRQRGPVPLLLVGLPSFLPLALVLVAPWVGLPLLALFCWLVRRLTSGNDPLWALVASQLTTPVFFAASLVFPNSLTWRSRKIQLRGDTIEYRR